MSTQVIDQLVITSVLFGDTGLRFDNFVFDTIDDTGPVIPAPGALILMASALAGAAGFRRYR